MTHPTSKRLRALGFTGMAHLVEAGWTGCHDNLSIIHCTGLGKSWIACAPGREACRDGQRVLYHQAPRLLEALAITRGGGRHARLLKAIERTGLLSLDDWGLSILTLCERRYLLAILEDRHGRGSTIMTNQRQVEDWHEATGDPTLDDAILDRRVHNAYRDNIARENMRKDHRRKQAKGCESKMPERPLLSTKVRTDPMSASASLPTIMRWLPMSA
jgi:hypothetical protein